MTSLLPNALILLLGIVVAVIALCLLRTPRRQMIAALKAGEFVVHYQPLIDLRTEKCTGVEALLRWHRPDGKMISPDIFIPEAECNGVIASLTDHVINASLADLADELRTLPQFHVAINVGAQDMQSGRILTVLEAALSEHAIRPQQVWLEATECGFRDVEAMQLTLTRARARGHIIAIDDFGTGYSSLSCLEGLSLDVLKIDKSFVSEKAGKSRIVGHIIAMAKSLGLRIVAEGIETKAQAGWLREAGVEYGQGWLYAKAMSATALKTYLKEMDAHRLDIPESANRAGYMRLVCS